MAGAKKDSRLNNRTSRLRLKARHKPYWLAIAEGMALGYRRGRRGGSFYGRTYEGGGKYRVRDLGEDDDYVDANGETILTFYQAQERVRDLGKERDQQRGIGVAADATVRQAATNYLEWFRVHKKSVRETEHAVNAHILPALGDLKLANLKAKTLRDWLDALATQPARVRSKKSETKYRAAPKTQDQKRARRATANRILNVLKALLNRAFYDGLVGSDIEWRKVKPFGNADGSRKEHFTQAQALSLIEAARKIDPSLADLLEAGYHTGARPPGELAALNVHHFMAELAQLTIGEGKTGVRDTTLTNEGVAFFERLVEGKESGDVLLPRADGKRWAKNHHVRLFAEALAAARLQPSATIYAMRHTYISLAGLHRMPIHAVAKNVGTSVKMIEKHYGKFFAHDFQRIVQQHAPTLRVVPTIRQAA
jgi:hypothetical protein